jgi:hypothetical protein
VAIPRMNRSQEIAFYPWYCRAIRGQESLVISRGETEGLENPGKKSCICSASFLCFIFLSDIFLSESACFEWRRIR